MLKRILDGQLQGTVSWVIGIHSPMHSYYVWKSWKVLYGKYPDWKEFICILLHDVGHLGKRYLDYPEEKHIHWKLGARICGWLFGYEYFLLIAGHCKQSKYPESKLYRPDKYSWYLHPEWWQRIYATLEPKVRLGRGYHDAYESFMQEVRASVESGEFRSTQDIYLAMKKEAECNSKHG